VSGGMLWLPRRGRTTKIPSVLQQQQFRRFTGSLTNIVGVSSLDEKDDLSRHANTAAHIPMLMLSTYICCRICPALAATALSQQLRSLYIAYLYLFVCAAFYCNKGIKIMATTTNQSRSRFSNTVDC
jgi:uncharacterized iron-regulated membrane protein